MRLIVQICHLMKRLNVTQLAGICILIKSVNKSSWHEPIHDCHMMGLQTDTSWSICTRPISSTPPYVRVTHLSGSSDTRLIQHRCLLLRRKSVDSGWCRLYAFHVVYWAKMMHKRIKTFGFLQQNQESLLKTTRLHWNAFERLARALIKRYWGHQCIEKGSAGRGDNHDFRSRSWVIKTSFPVKRKGSGYNTQKCFCEPYLTSVKTGKNWSLLWQVLLNDSLIHAQVNQHRQ